MDRFLFFFFPSIFSLSLYLGRLVGQLMMLIYSGRAVDDSLTLGRELLKHCTLLMPIIRAPPWQRIVAVLNHNHTVAVFDIYPQTVELRSMNCHTCMQPVSSRSPPSAFSRFCHRTGCFRLKECCWLPSRHK